MVPKTLTNIDGLTSLPFVILPKIIILSQLLYRKNFFLASPSLPKFSRAIYLVSNLFLSFQEWFTGTTDPKKGTSYTHRVLARQFDKKQEEKKSSFLNLPLIQFESSFWGKRSIQSMCSMWSGEPSILVSQYESRISLLVARDEFIDAGEDRVPV